MSNGAASVVVTVVSGVVYEDDIGVSLINTDDTNVSSLTCDDECCLGDNVAVMTLSLISVVSIIVLLIKTIKQQKRVIGN
jgi:hypothetical protein